MPKLLHHRRVWIQLNIRRSNRGAFAGGGWRFGRFGRFGYPYYWLGRRLGVGLALLGLCGLLQSILRIWVLSILRLRLVRVRVSRKRSRLAEPSREVGDPNPSPDSHARHTRQRCRYAGARLALFRRIFSLYLTSNIGALLGCGLQESALGMDLDGRT